MELLATHPVKKSDLGFHGNLFGGKLLSWLDASVAAYAMETMRNRRMVTIAIDKCEFKKPAKEGSLVKIYAEISQIGKSSVTFNVEARAFNVYTHKDSVILSTKFIFVRIDEDGNPIPISKQVIDDFNERRQTD
jgi:acyl-CoA thioesterase YciA